MKKYKYDVVLSFAGEDRDYAEKLVTELTKRNLKVFYDYRFQASLWGADLFKLFARIYSRKALHAVTIISRHYMTKSWALHELKFIQEREFSEGGDYWLPLFLEKVEVPGLPETKGFVEASKCSISEIANMIYEKVVHSQITEDDEEFESDLKTMEITLEDGSSEVVEVLLSFTHDKFGKEYIIYTKQERDDNDNVTIYVAELNHSSGEPILLSIESEEEWKEIRTMLRMMSDSEDTDLATIYNEPRKFDADGTEIL